MTLTQYSTATSFDGFIADRDHSLTWLFDVPRADDHPDAFAPFFADVGAVAMGSTTFEWVVAEEGMRGSPDKWQDTFGDRPTWVFSSRDLDPLPGADIRFVSGAVAPVHRDMVAAADGRNVWLVGGGDLVGQFADSGLLDEIHVAIQPVFLGDGAPLLPRRITSERMHLRSVERVGQELQVIYDVVSADSDPDNTVTDGTTADDTGQDDPSTDDGRAEITDADGDEDGDEATDGGSGGETDGDETGATPAAGDETGDASGA